jgi:hypothetical protein
MNTVSNPGGELSAYHLGIFHQLLRSRFLGSLDSSNADRCEIRLFLDDPEFRPSVLGPGLFIVSGNGWPLLPITYG